MTASAPASGPRPAAYPLSKILIAGLAAIILSIVANLIVRAIGMAIINVPTDFSPLATWQPVIIFTTLFIVIATVIWWIITRRSAAPERTFNIVAFIGLLVSLIPDILLLTSPGMLPMGTATVGAVMILIVMHIVSWLITVWALTRLSRA